MSKTLEQILTKSRDYYYHDGLISSEVDIVVEEIDRLRQQVEQLTAENEKLRKYIKVIEFHVVESHGVDDWAAASIVDITTEALKETSDVPPPPE